MTTTTGSNGVVLFASLSLLVVGGGALFAAQLREHKAMGSSPAGLHRDAPLREAHGDEGARAESAPARVDTATAAGGEAPMGRPEKGPSDAAAALVNRLVTLLVSQVDGDPAGDAEEIARLAGELAAMGETAGAVLSVRIDSLRGKVAVPLRDRLLDVLRRIPGPTAEARLIKEARSGTAESSRALAIDALAERRTDRAIDALSRIAETDPDVPEKPLIAEPRSPSDVSTELPDEVVFTPRMQAMAALAATGDARAARTLAGVLHDGPDEALRMEAARNLESLRDAPGTMDALRRALATDPSPYVRLAALHALSGATDPTLAPVLQNIALSDRDAGVRALAQQVLASLRP